MIPLQEVSSKPQTVLKRSAVLFPESPVFATQDSDETMQLQRSALAIGGRASEAAQSVPTVGQD